MNKNPPRRARALTAGLVALLLAALAAALVLWRQWAAAGENSVPAVSVTLDGEELLQHGGSWETPLLGGLLTRRLALSYPALGKVLTLDSDQPPLAAAPADAPSGAVCPPSSAAPPACSSRARRARSARSPAAARAARA